MVAKLETNRIITNSVVGLPSWKQIGLKLAVWWGCQVGQQIYWMYRYTVVVYDIRPYGRSWIQYAICNAWHLATMLRIWPLRVICPHCLVSDRHVKQVSASREYSILFKLSYIYIYVAFAALCM